MAMVLTGSDIWAAVFQSGFQISIQILEWYARYESNAGFFFNLSIAKVGANWPHSKNGRA